jgi:hypothetical protein
VLKSDFSLYLIDVSFGAKAIGASRVPFEIFSLF